MKRGKKPLPNEIAKLHGDKRYIKKNPVKVKPAETIKIPKYIPKKVRKKYLDLANKLINLAILTPIDYPAFNLMMLHYSLCIEAIEKIKEYGTYIKDRNIIRKNPACQILRDNSNAFIKYASYFGMLPTERSRLATKPVYPLSKGDAEFEKLLNGYDYKLEKLLD